ncbi:MAG TPA: glycerol-3-phosphate acyltransferase [Candidatus Acidoferrales bacterium]|nr:glycerol-3-phosphate acyltransferase [Candidatus Acidoferrales bacterium]
MFNLALAVVAYLIGSFPTAYVVGKQARGIDILRNGTGNVGAMNAYDVTGSKLIGVTVGTIDILKGIAVTMIAQHIFGLTGSTIVSEGDGRLGLCVMAGFFAVLGHNYSVFIKFKGGRGLATAAGALLIVQPLSVAIYLAIYISLRAAKLKLYLSSVFGILIASIPLLAKFAAAPIVEVFAALLLIVVLSKHMIPLKDELQNGI